MPPAIVSCSRRSDVPALHARWLMRRVRAGWVDVTNPMNARQVRRVSLQRDDVAGLVLWTRWPAPLWSWHSEICDRLGPPLWLITLNNYPRVLEPRSPPAPRVVEQMQRLAIRDGCEAVHWRYDPIVVSSRTPPAFHVDNFGQLARALRGATRHCHVSFVDLHYRKTQRRLTALAATGVQTQETDRAQRRSLVRQLAALGREEGIEVLACCAQDLCDPPQLDLDGEEPTGVRAAGCVEMAWLRALRGDTTPDPPSRPTRPGCLCQASVDIGAYDTCSLGCVYCYATRSDAAGRDGRRRVDVGAPNLRPNSG
ncbi:MAG: DUF1848 family protein [Pseudomonadota bacterium]